MSVTEGYRRWQFWESVQIVAGTVAAVAFFFFNQGTIALIAVGVCWAINSVRKRWSRFFWNQAMGLHSSKLEGEPDILNNLKPRHQAEFKVRARKKFMG
ncbi:hypothetical protein [Streptomyces sp. CoH17]|uniref:hypothetical protein n=1 Tax=Streptomyces sp. CoH17 TaxID=2992806 RepID=UPI002270AFAA|nr:hypothetical protein [Streptomyces sp. CoH17]